MDLDDRMKAFERSHSLYLPPRMPVMIRIDRKAFHTYTRNLAVPFDEGLVNLMNMTAVSLMQEIQNASFAYVQSDEISIFCNTYTKLSTQPWLGNRIQRVTSVAASIATFWFNALSALDISEPAMFDARTWVLPKEEVTNYFIWRQQDATRNSIQSVAQSFFSQSQLHGKNQDDIQDMLIKERSVNWNKYDIGLKRGRVVYWQEGIGPRLDVAPPVFTKDRDYVECHVQYMEEE